MNSSLTLLVAFIVCSLSVCRGQPTLSVSATVSPTFSRTYYNYRYFFPESDGQVVEPVYINGRRWATGYTAGVSVLYTYAPGWTVASGLWYQQLSTRQDRQPTAGEGTVTLRSRAIRFPVLLQYALTSKRLSPYFTLGLLVNIPVTSRVIVRRGTEPTQYLRLLTSRSPVFQGLVGAGLQYRMSERYTLLVQPAWTYTFGQFGGANSHNDSFELSLQTQATYSF